MTEGRRLHRRAEHLEQQPRRLLEQGDAGLQIGGVIEGIAAQQIVLPVMAPVDRDLLVEAQRKSTAVDSNGPTLYNRTLHGWGHGDRRAGGSRSGTAA